MSDVGDLAIEVMLAVPNPVVAWQKEEQKGGYPEFAVAALRPIQQISPDRRRQRGPGFRRHGQDMQKFFLPAMAIMKIREQRPTIDYRNRQEQEPAERHEEGQRAADHSKPNHDSRQNGEQRE